MLEFLKENAFIIAEIILTLLVFIISACKRKVKVVDNSLSSILDKIPSFITLAENLVGSGNGSSKKALVLKYAKAFYCAITGLNDFEDIEPVIETFIEKCLETPQKKESNYEKNESKSS